jgi:spermidine synthase
MRLLPRFVAFWVGCTSLVQEVLWVRLLGFAESGLPESFAIVLTLYLLGIALGASFGRRICASSVELVISKGGRMLLLSGIVDLVAPGVFALLVQFTMPKLAAAPLIVVTAALKSALFPVVHHLGSNDISSFKGASFSRVYFFNVLGCTLGPLVVALFLLDVMSMQQLFAAVAGVTCFVAAVMLGRSGWGLVSAIIAGFCFISTLWLPNAVAAIAGLSSDMPPKILLENKEGIIHTIPSDGGDIVFGGNVYDGRINTDLRINSNKIDRIYALMLAHPSPKSILVIGVSGGAWMRVISSFPSIEEMDAVEINPGYLKLIASYPEVAPILEDERINFHIDDGRHWLRFKTERKYDVIVVNSTFHWRSGATGLLSSEFMALVRKHLSSEGVALINATGSPEVLKTAGSVFSHAYLYGNSVLMSDVDFRGNVAAGAGRIYQTMLDGRPVFTRGVDVDDDAIEGVVSRPFSTLDQIERSKGRKAEIISDMNMLTEYKYGASAQ